MRDGDVQYLRHRLEEILWIGCVDVRCDFEFVLFQVEKCEVGPHIGVGWIELRRMTPCTLCRALVSTIVVSVAKFEPQTHIPRILLASIETDLDGTRRGRWPLCWLGTQQATVFGEYIGWRRFSILCHQTTEYPASLSQTVHLQQQEEDPRFRVTGRRTMTCLQKDINFEEQDVIHAYFMLFAFLQMLDNAESSIEIFSQESDLCLEDISWARVYQANVADGCIRYLLWLSKRTAFTWLDMVQTDFRDICILDIQEMLRQFMKWIFLSRILSVSLLRFPLAVLHFFFAIQHCQAPVGISRDRSQWRT